MAREKNLIRVLICDREAQAFAEIDQAEVDAATLHIVAWATTAEELHDQLKKSRPDVLVFDMDIPGVDATKELRAIYLESLPVGTVVILNEQDTQRVRAAMRLGVEDFQVRPVAPEALVASILNIYNHVVQRHPDGWKDDSLPEVDKRAVGAGKLFGVTSGKAGVGKTVIGTNLAIAMARESHKKVALLDLDRGDSALLLDVHPERALLEIIDNIQELDAAGMEGYHTAHNSGIVLLVGSNDPDVRDLEVIKPDALEYLFSLLRVAFDYTVVNLPVLVGRSEMSILSLMDEGLCVTTARDLLDIRATRAYVARIKGVDAELGAKVKIVANSVVPSRYIGEEELQHTFGCSVIATIVENEELVTTAVNSGNPFIQKAPSSPVSEGVTNLARRLLGMQVSAEGKRGGLLGFFGRG